MSTRTSSASPPSASACLAAALRRNAAARHRADICTAAPRQERTKLRNNKGFKLKGHRHQFHNQSLKPLAFKPGSSLTSYRPTSRARVSTAYSNGIPAAANRFSSADLVVGGVVGGQRGVCVRADESNLQNLKPKKMKGSVV